MLEALFGKTLRQSADALSVRLFPPLPTGIRSEPDKSEIPK